MFYPRKQYFPIFHLRQEVIKIGELKYPFSRKLTPKLQNEEKNPFFDADLLSFALMLHVLIPIQFWYHFDEQKTEQTQLNQ
jgi:hypothetical protein